jgi:hypothetical protein
VGANRNYLLHNCKEKRMDYNKNRFKVTRFLSDEMYNILLGENWYEEQDEEELTAELGILSTRMDELVTQPALKALCEVLGHQVIQDQCGRPEHDYCYHCMEQRPDEAKR